MQDDELDFAQQQRQSVIQHKEQWEHDAAEKQRLTKMQEDHQQFQQQIVSRRQGEFEELQVQHHFFSAVDSDALAVANLVQCAGGSSNRCDSPCQHGF